MEHLIPITITIADRSYRIKVAPENEELVRKTIHYLNDKVLFFKTQFEGLDMQDNIAMTMAWYATQPQAAITQEIADKEIHESLTKLEAQIDKALGE